MRNTCALRLVTFLCEVRTWTRAVRRRHVTGIFSCDYLLVPLHHEAVSAWMNPHLRRGLLFKSWQLAESIAASTFVGRRALCHLEVQETC